MKKPCVLSALAFLSVPVHAAQATAVRETCDQLRSEILAQRGIPTVANQELLRKMSDRTDCKFTAPEVYRAAFAEKPLPNDYGRRNKHSPRDDDHDDED